MKIKGFFYAHEKIFLDFCPGLAYNYLINLRETKNMTTSLDQSDYLNTHRFTQEEWDWLIRAGNELVQGMILHSVRVRTDFNRHTLEEVTDWLKINATDFYYIKSTYQSTYQFLTVYFAGTIDKDAFERITKSIKIF